MYRVVKEHGTSYLLKAKFGSLYDPGCLVPAYLKDQRIASVVALFPTKRNTLWTQVGDWMVIVYPLSRGGYELDMDDG